MDRKELEQELGKLTHQVSTQQQRVNDSQAVLKDLIDKANAIDKMLMELDTEP